MLSLKRKNSPHLVWLPVCLLVLTSCKKFTEIPPPRTQVQTSILFASDQGVLSAVAGMYSQMVAGNLWVANGGATLYPSLSAGDIYNTTPNTDIDGFTFNNLNANTGTGVSTIWRTAYKNIYNANSILGGIEASPSVTDSIRSTAKGEALVVRALNYFYLVNFFGDVPLMISTDYETNQAATRTAISTIYGQIINDLKEAQGLLKTTYPSSGRVRPNRFATTALLARTYLYMREWAKAEAESSSIINSGIYNLIPSANLHNTFQANSTEAVWQLMRETQNTTDGGMLIPSSSSVKPGYAISPFLLNAFEVNDQRKSISGNGWLGKNSVSGIDYYFPAKYKERIATTPVKEYQMILRLSEQYLIRAEARAQQNNASGALQDLNVVRSRAGLGNSTAVTMADILIAIEHERQTEFFCEWGHRWFDLKRNGRADDVLSIQKAPYWQSTDALYPIPFYELQTNPLLVQNPGY